MAFAATSTSRYCRRRRRLYRRSVRLADRVSVNLEAPNAGRIAALSTTKDFERDLLATLVRANDVRQGATPG